MPSQLYIFGNMHQDDSIATVASMIDRLDDCDFSIYVEESFFAYLQSRGAHLPQRVRGCAEPTGEGGDKAVISFGGDGTFLNAVAWLRGRDIPVMGVNTGHLGYLAAFPADKQEAIVKALRRNTLKMERRFILHLECPGMPADFWPYALNEIALLKDETASMIKVDTNIDGIFLARYAVDGLLFTTATGSTAYNLSVGGPLLQPTLDNIVISPIAPHSLTMRPLVVSGDSWVEAKVMSRSGRFRISADGRSFTLPSDSSLAIKRSSHRVSILLPSAANFAKTLRRKLGWAT